MSAALSSTPMSAEESAAPPSVAPAAVAEGTTVSRKKQKKAVKVTQKIKAVDGSVDVRVQHTNDDSVVSKRSAVAHGYMRDRFLRYFVTKPSRRSPLINRGYYLRMAVMTNLVVRLVKCFLGAPERHTGARPLPSPPPVQVLSLGAGYDTLALRLLLDSVDTLLSPSPVTSSFPGGEVLFMDVDFAAVLQSKAALLAAATPRCVPDEWQLAPQSPDCPIRGPHYAAVGVDLRVAEAELMGRLRRDAPAGFDPANPTIIYAECVMQYMPHEDAARLVALLASGFPNAVFLAYDQVSPADSFGRVMQASLRQKNSPLLGIQACPDGSRMTRRALAAGMRRAWWGDFYRVSAFCLDGAERDRVAALEDFDEHEEWSEMCEHYGLTMAVTQAVWGSVAAMGCGGHPAFVEYTADGAACGGHHHHHHNQQHQQSVAEASLSGTLRSWPSARYGFEGWGNGGVAVEALANGDRLLISFGGFAVGKQQHHRVNTVYAHSLQEGELRVVIAGAASPPPLVFHSFTRVAAGAYVVWGGRTSPSAPSNSAFLLSLDVPRTVSLGSTLTARWTALRATADEVHCSPSPRSRHSMVHLASDGDVASLLLLGGKLAPGASDSPTLECVRVTVQLRELTVAYDRLFCTPAPAEGGGAPPSLYSAAAVALSADEVLLSGGVVARREVCNEHLWRLCIRRKEWRRVPVSLGAGRYSHTMTRVAVDGDEHLLVLGGSTWTEKSHVAPALLVSLSRLDTGADDNTSTSPPTALAVALPPDAPWWSRHSCVALGDGVVGVIAGGYTCFSFGTFAAKPQLLLLGNTVDESAWHPDTAGSVAHDGAGVAGAAAPELVYSYDRLLSKPWPAVREVPTYSAAAFLAEAVTKGRAATPVVFRDVPLGACVTRWRSAAYLSEAEGDATVSVHVAERSQTLDFVRKNFAFRHVTLAELVRHVEAATRVFCETQQTPPETWYYRSVAGHMKSERANVWVDFPVLGKDFALPPGAKEHIEPRLHQSCLRMNAAPLQLWTHYDALDNVLCQIVGTKRVVLFPPSEYNNLYVTGSSSAVIHLDAPDLVRYPRLIQACQAAQEVILRPGDMLFLPAMWFHHITTLPPDAAAGSAAPYNVSVNVFYRHFTDAAVYDAKDLYGNKDILAMTRLREDLLSITRDAVASARLTPSEDAPRVPPTYAEFALRQFAQDVETTATAMADAHRAGPSA